MNHTLLMTLILIASVSGVHAQRSSPNARTVLNAMLAKYESASSYEDVGELTVMSSEGATVRADTKRATVTFRTYFKRPRMFRFDWRASLWPSTRDFVVWWDGEHAYSWTMMGPTESEGFVFDRESSLNGLIGHRIRKTGGVIFTIPSLLMPDVAPSTFGDVINKLTDLIVSSEEAVDGELCYLISGKIDGVPWSLWVGKKSLLLRKTRSTGYIGSFHRDDGSPNDLIFEEVRRQIRINTAIDDSLFQYRPVLQKGDVDITGSACCP